MQKANQAGYDEKIKQLLEMYRLVDEAEAILEDKHRILMTLDVFLMLPGN